MQDLAPLKGVCGTIWDYLYILRYYGVLKNRGNWLGDCVQKHQAWREFRGWYQLTSWNCCPTGGVPKPTVGKWRGNSMGMSRQQNWKMTILFGGGDQIHVKLFGVGISWLLTWVLLRWKLGTFAFERYDHISPRIWTYSTWSLSKNNANNLKIHPIQSWSIQKYWAQACDMYPVSIFSVKFWHTPRLPTAGVLLPPQSHLELPPWSWIGNMPRRLPGLSWPQRITYCLDKVKKWDAQRILLITTWYLVSWLVYQIIILAPDPSSTCSVLALASSESMSSQQT